MNSDHRFPLKVRNSGPDFDGLGRLMGNIICICAMVLSGYLSRV